MKTCVIAIGNSDDKLSQVQWAGFCKVVEEFVDRYSHQVYAKTYALTNSEYQNAVFLFAVPEATISYIRIRLGHIAVQWKQDSIALGIFDTEMIQPSENGRDVGAHVLTTPELKPGEHIEVQHGIPHQRNASKRFRNQ